MKIDIVLTACNLNSYYLNLYPYTHRVWKERFGLDLYLVLISDSIPPNLHEYANHIILFEPITGLNTSYMAQVIRILYPALFHNLNVLITDIDIFPISRTYFIDHIQPYSDTQFVSYTDRYMHNQMIAICYNVANSKIWGEITGIQTVDDIRRILVDNYMNEYTGQKNCAGWYSDQCMLYKFVKEYEQSKSMGCENANEPNIPRVIFLNDSKIGYKRLDGKSANKLLDIKNNKTQILNNIKTYSDFHIIRNYHLNIELFEEIIQAIIVAD